MGIHFPNECIYDQNTKIKNERVSGKINLTERSILSDYRIFAKMLYDDGKITAVEWKLYEDWFKWLSYEFNSVPKKLYTSDAIQVSHFKEFAKEAAVKNPVLLLNISRNYTNITTIGY